MKRIILILIFLFWLISISFFFGCISLVGWYAVIFIAISWSTLTSILVEKIPKDKKSQEYGYFISRGNLGATNGCYGQVYFLNKYLTCHFLKEELSL